jgi:hypothetical protein
MRGDAEIHGLGIENQTPKDDHQLGNLIRQIEE